MKRSLLFIAIIALAAFALSGCQFVIGFIFETDLSIENIQLVFSGDEFTGVEITVRNDGAKVEDVKYDVVLSADQNADYGDTVLYNDQFNIDFKDTTNIWVPVDNMDLFAVDDPPGEYYFGIILDVDDKDSSDNSATSRDWIYWEGGGGATLPEDMYEYDNDQASAYYASLPAYQYHTFHYNGDVDWVMVDVPEGYYLVAETWSAGGVDCDTEVFIFDTFGQVAYNDDKPAGGWYSRAEYYVGSGYGGTYFVRVEELDNYTGEYDLELDLYSPE